jgi:hypothetical protein
MLCTVRGGGRRHDMPRFSTTTRRDYLFLCNPVITLHPHNARRLQERGTILELELLSGSGVKSIISF